MPLSDPKIEVFITIPEWSRWPKGWTVSNNYNNKH